MPSPRFEIRNRRGWPDAHLLQLACGHDYFREAWGDLSTIPADAMPGVLADMAACWEMHGEEITSEHKAKHGLDSDPWFARYTPAAAAPAANGNT